MARKGEGPGQKWIRFLRGYTPNAQSQRMFAEHISNLAQHYGIEPIAFEHPFREQLYSYFFTQDGGGLLPSGDLRNVVLTGTAGDGKTSLCYDLWTRLCDSKPPTGNIGTCFLQTPTGKAQVTFIFDFSSWTSVADGRLDDSCHELLKRFSGSVLGEEQELFVIAINDGQFGELWRSLPDESPVLALKPVITELHASSSVTCDKRLVLHNLSTIKTTMLFDRAYDAIMFRQEWACLEEQADDQEFGSKASLRNNYDAIRLPGAKARLREVIEICDASQIHIPIRELLMWICNILLGHPAAPDGVARPQDLQRVAESDTSHLGAFHKNVFGHNLKGTQRTRYAIFRMLDALRLGEETINDLDELILFGDRIPDLMAWYHDLVESDPLSQRDPTFAAACRDYVDDDQEDVDTFLESVADERRRLFFLGDKDTLEDALGKRSMWITTIFHSADDYLGNVARVTEKGESVSSSVIRKLVRGLNRIWTGHLCDDDERLFVAKGLDLSSAPISDILVLPIPILDDWGEERIVVVGPRPGALVPQVSIKWKADTDAFLFDLTLPRYEFLTRVAKGVMPTAFSKECWEDIITLKTRLLRVIGGVGRQASSIRHIGTNKDGMIVTETIASC